MRIRSVIISLVVLLPGEAATASAQSTPTPDFWVVAGSQVDGRTRTVLFVDTNTISAPQPNFARVWVWLYVSPHIESWAAGGHSLFQYEYDCSGARSRVAEGSGYNADGSASDVPARPGWETVEPWSVDGAVLTFACSPPEQRRMLPDVVQIGDENPASIASRLFAAH